MARFVISLFAKTKNFAQFALSSLRCLNEYQGHSIWSGETKSYCSELRRSIFERFSGERARCEREARDTRVGEGRGKIAPVLLVRVKYKGE